MVMGGDSRSEGREFESEHRILVGHFFTLMCCNVCLKKTEHKRKRGRGWPIFKKILELPKASNFFSDDLEFIDRSFAMK